MKHFLTLAAGLAFASTMATAQSFPQENTYTYGALTFLDIQSTRNVNSWRATGGYQYSLGDTLLFGEFGVKETTVANFPTRNSSGNVTRLGVAQSFGDFQVGLEYRYREAYRAARPDIYYGTTTLFANYDTEQFGAMMTVRKSSNYEHLYGEFGGHVQLSDTIDALVLGYWNVDEGLEEISTTLGYDDGPLAAGLTLGVYNRSPNFDWASFYVEYDVSSNFGVGIRYETVESGTSQVNLSASYQISDNMRLVSEFNRYNGASGFDVDRIGLQFVYETGTNRRYDQRLTTDILHRSDSTLATGNRLFLR